MGSRLAVSITKKASKQTYYTIRYLADRDRVDDAYRAYAYFRWVDDVLDAKSVPASKSREFVARQKSLLERCYQNQVPQDVNLQENLLVELVRHDTEKESGLQHYLCNMMQVMNFDTMRRGRLVSEAELDEYTHWLAMAVMEAIHHFIGHDDFSPRDKRRYLAVSAAHITHMLRDTFEDAQLGYYNIPGEVLAASHVGPLDVYSEAYRTWVKYRVRLAREYFQAGREYIAQVENPRCRLACCAYVARFEWLLDTIEREGFLLRPRYDERKSTGTGLRMSWQTMMSMLNHRDKEALSVLPPSSGKL